MIGDKKDVSSRVVSMQEELYTRPTSSASGMGSLPSRVTARHRCYLTKSEFYACPTLSATIDKSVAYHAQ
jgi:hypothetical protein